MFDCGVVRMCLWLILYELEYAYASWCIALIGIMYNGMDRSICLLLCCLFEVEGNRWNGSG